MSTASPSPSMTQNSPWSVKGVDPEAREAAKIAARRQGLPLGRWLSQTILSAAARELKGGGRRENMAVGSDIGAGQGSGPDNIYPHPRQGERRDPFAASPQGYPQQGYAPPPPYGQAGPPALTPEAILESLHRLAGRIEQSETRTAEAIAPIAEKVGELSAQLEDIKSRTGTSTAPVERAMMRLTERLERLEEGRDGGRSRTAAPEGGEGGGLLHRLFGRD